MGEGFYFLDENNNLIYGPNEICDAGFHLVKEDHESYNYPICGWYWFDSEEEARLFFEID